MPRGTRKSQASGGDPPLWDLLVSASSALSLGALWFLYRVLDVRDRLSLGLTALAAGVGLGLALVAVVLLLRRLRARPASVAATFNIFGGAILIGTYLLSLGGTRPGWSCGDLLAFGLFLVLYGLLILVIGRLRLLERLPL